ncbi:MAG: hypothetical protein AAF804_12915, partial [Bacteroidota bacterium]
MVRPILPRLVLFGLFCSVFLSFACAQAINGELKKWHNVTLVFEGPTCSETDDYNPFFNYRLNVTFT